MLGSFAFESEMFEVPSVENFDLILLLSTTLSSEFVFRVDQPNQREEGRTEYS